MEEEFHDASVSRSWGASVALVSRLCRTDLKAIMVEAENGKKQVHTRTPDSLGSSTNMSSTSTTSVNARSSPSLGTSALTSTVQSVSPLRQPGHAPVQLDQPPTPRHVPSDSVMLQRLEPVPAATPSPSGTKATVRTTQPTQASPGPLRPAMGPMIIPVRQTPSTSGSTSAGGSSRKPSCVSHPLT